MSMTEPDSGDSGRAKGPKTVNRFRNKPFDRRFLYAFAISAAFHLSAVTVFKVVIYFQVPEISFYEFRFVQPPRVGPTSTPAERAFAERWERLPRIEAPLLGGFEGRLALARRDLQAPEALESLFQNAEEAGPLPRLGEALMENSLSQDRLTLGGEGLSLGPDITGNVQNVAPAAGFMGQLTWPNRDGARPLLFACPLPNLWSIDANLLDKGLTFELNVDDSGRVTRVWTNMLVPGVDLDELTKVLLQYRFEPESDGPGIVETVQFIIREAEAGP